METPSEPTVRLMVESRTGSGTTSYVQSDLVFNRLYPALGKAVAKAAANGTGLDDVRQAKLILFYRFLFVLYAEDRSLLPVRD